VIKHQAMCDESVNNAESAVQLCLLHKHLMITALRLNEWLVVEKCAR